MVQVCPEIWQEQLVFKYNLGTNSLFTTSYTQGSLIDLFF